MRWRTIALTYLCLAAVSAGAQVNRCKDASGKIIYSDQPCATGQSGMQIERQRSREEILQEREQAYEAELRKQERRMAEQDRALSQQQRGAAQSPPAVMQPTEGWQERKNRENAATSAKSITNNGGQWDAEAQARRAAERREAARKEEAANPPPAIITNCNTGFCYDNQGGVYHKSGQNFMTGPNGRTCHRAGNSWNCN
ncbi:MAG: DUF4124 domain-containing protein [Acidovorax sp.]|uniref:DUF4124 domain-containing protein n=1 Tax=Acidovorax sp. TaxID=1872122 RepID=UPI00391D473F